jgi:hypothetical protein
MRARNTAGAAMCTPTRRLPSSSLAIERVVNLGGLLVVDGEGNGIGFERPAGSSSPGIASKPVPRGKSSKAKRRRKKSSGPASAPASASTRCGVAPAACAAASSARHSSAILSGLNRSTSSFSAMGGGTRPAARSPAHASTCSCARRFFSASASAARRLSSGAAWYRPLPRR